MKTAQDSNSIVDKVIANITEDQQALEKQNTVIENAKNEKREIISRLKDSRQDLLTVVKYANEEQMKRIETLGIETNNLKASLNNVAQVAFDILQKSPKGEMTNGDLYDQYVKSCKKSEDSLGYGDFNIKCRPLFNSQKLIRIVAEGKSSQEYLIRINGFEKKEATKKIEKPTTSKKVVKKTK